MFEGGARTNRTARSRSSGEYLFECFMAPVSQGLEPPGNPVRFTTTAPARCATLARPSREGISAVFDARTMRAARPPHGLSKRLREEIALDHIERIHI